MSSKDTPHVLSVEDNAETRRLLKIHLRDSYTVTSVADENGAMEAVEGNAFDLLLLDINLQSEDAGVELLRAIRERDDLSDSPAIAVTAFAMPGDRECLLNEGFDAYVAKPFTKATLLSTIEETLASHSVET